LILFHSLYIEDPIFIRDFQVFYLFI